MSYDHCHLASMAAQLIERDPALWFEETASRLGCHRHTLHQALSEAGQDFAAIKYGAVLQLLRNKPTIKQARVAAGFSSSSAFARYIRRATGKTPTQLRAEFSYGQKVPELAKVVLDLPGGAK